MSDIAPWDHKNFDEDAFNRTNAALQATYYRTPKGRAEALRIQLGLCQIEWGGGTSERVERQIARLEHQAAEDERSKLRRDAATVGLILG